MYLQRHKISASLGAQKGARNPTVVLSAIYSYLRSEAASERKYAGWMGWDAAIRTTVTRPHMAIERGNGYLSMGGDGDEARLKTAECPVQRNRNGSGAGRV